MKIDYSITKNASSDYGAVGTVGSEHKMLFLDKIGN